ncbi:GAF domain-containing sensor histidine kinase [Mycolicibacterium rhodesiae]|uniref:Oxygen sensor histidine kinase NreB n=1 Tax=Mycolicibacterium rhodesiae TaxID=36814 RepID=A0A1X0IS30_MYCRH|nr:GAF domain-containing protein [Mycolicibacterium rhodesiae]MCV7343634.1 GAF domain-containing protein [Mycolicibacterium rhodesiae]ORB50928.1 histidine kinase [Mycolicibacterium rhodesiae]
MTPSATEPRAGAPVRDRLLALLLRPTPPPTRWGVLTAIAFIAAETLIVHVLKQVAPDDAFGAIFLLGVLVVSAGWGFRLALATSVASAMAYVWFHVNEGSGSLVPAVVVFLTLALLTNLLVGQARLRAAEAMQRRIEADVAAELASVLAGQQAALRRVATLVARGAVLEELYPVAVAELARGLGVQHVNLLRFAGDGCIPVATYDVNPARMLAVGEFVALEGDSVAGTVRRTAQPSRIDDYRNAHGSTASRLRDLGLRCGVGAPIIVDGVVWGAMVVDCDTEQPLPGRTEDRVADFADLVATAVANAETRAELQASRARIVTAADQARRRFERDLHDGAQQRIVSLGLELRALEASAPDEPAELREQLGAIIDGLGHLHTDLQELSRGIHPAILSRGGLGPAIKTLARRSPVPVTLDVEVDRRLGESVEVAAYYVVAEALTNAAKYAQAAEVTVWARVTDADLALRIADDGIGGAGAGGGSGLIGLKDRVEALSGHLGLVSESGAGTTISVTIPLTAPGG